MAANPDDILKKAMEDAKQAQREQVRAELKDEHERQLQLLRAQLLARTKVCGRYAGDMSEI